MFFPATSFRSFPIYPPSLKPRPSAPHGVFSPFNRYFAPFSLPLLSTPFADSRRAVWPDPPCRPTPTTSAHGRACRFLNETNRGMPSAREACRVFDGAPGFHRAKKRMANGHSLIPLLLPAPRRRQPISSKTRPPARTLPAIPSANGSKLRRPNNQPAGCAGNFSMRPACSLGRRTPKKNRARNRARKERMGNG